MPGTNRIAIGSGGAPTTDFYLDADVVGVEGIGTGIGYGRFLVHFYLTCVNRGNTSSSDSGFGFQRGYYNGNFFGSHEGTPFLPAGYGTNAQRWADGPWAVWINVNSDGYWTQDWEDMEVGMVVSYPSFSSGNRYGSIHLGRIGQIPKAPVSPIVDTPTQNSLRYRFTGGGDQGSAMIRYEAQYSTSSNFTSGNGPITSTGLGGTYTPTGLASRQKYYFRSRGVNGAGTGPWSSITNGDTLSVPDAPTLVAGTKTSTSITPTRTDPSYTGGTITARETQISTDPAFVSPAPVTTGLTSPSFISLQRGTQYHMRSRVQNSVGWSAWSPTLSVTTDVEQPSTPTGYTPHDIASKTAWSTMGSILDNGGVPLSALNYQINTSATATGATDVTLDTAREPMFSALTPGTTYYYRLRVSNGTLWSAWGDWVSFVAKTNVPHEPTLFAVDSVGDNSVVLEWAAPANLLGATLTGYRVWIGTNKALTTGVQTKDVGPTDLSAAFTGLPSGTPHFARAIALSTNGDGSSTGLVSFSTTSSGITPSILWEKISGTWKNIVRWERIAGVWKQIVVWENVSGTWKKQ